MTREADQHLGLLYYSLLARNYTQNIQAHLHHSRRLYLQKLCLLSDENVWTFSSSLYTRCQSYDSWYLAVTHYSPRRSSIVDVPWYDMNGYCGSHLCARGTVYTASGLVVQ